MPVSPASCSPASLHWSPAPCRWPPANMSRSIRRPIPRMPTWRASAPNSKTIPTPNTANWRLSMSCGGSRPNSRNRLPTQLMQHDALGAHARDELGISETLAAQPVQAALSSAASFAIGALLPLAVCTLVPGRLLIPCVATTAFGLPRAAWRHRRARRRRQPAGRRQARHLSGERWRWPAPPASARCSARSFDCGLGQNSPLAPSASATAIETALQGHAAAFPGLVEFESTVTNRYNRFHFWQLSVANTRRAFDTCACLAKEPASLSAQSLSGAAGCFSMDGSASRLRRVTPRLKPPAGRNSVISKTTVCLKRE